MAFSPKVAETPPALVFSGDGFVAAAPEWTAALRVSPQDAEEQPPTACSTSKRSTTPEAGTAGSRGAC